MTDDLIAPPTSINVVVYRDEPVPGWPAHYRRIKWCGMISRSDVERQQHLDPADMVLAFAGHVDGALHAVALDPEPTIVPIPPA